VGLRRRFSFWIENMSEFEDRLDEIEAKRRQESQERRREERLERESRQTEVEERRLLVSGVVDRVVTPVAARFCHKVESASGPTCEPVYGPESAKQTVTIKLENNRRIDVDVDVVADNQIVIVFRTDACTSPELQSRDFPFPPEAQGDDSIRKTVECALLEIFEDCAS